jgi:hypothetical protein
MPPSFLLSIHAFLKLALPKARISLLWNPIVGTLKVFRDMLYAQHTIVHNDHKHLLYESLTMQQIVRWRMLTEEYDVTFEHVEAGKDNLVADALSRLVDANFEK